MATPLGPAAVQGAGDSVQVRTARTAAGARLPLLLQWSRCCCLLFEHCGLPLSICCWLWCAVAAASILISSHFVSYRIVLDRIRSSEQEAPSSLSLPDLKTDLVFQKKRLDFNPTIEELRKRAFRYIKSIADFPMLFKGLGADEGLYASIPGLS